MILLSGLQIRVESNPSEDIGIKHTGLKPSKRLYEEFLIGDIVTSK